MNPIYPTAGTGGTIITAVVVAVAPTTIVAPAGSDRGAGGSGVGGAGGSGVGGAGGSGVGGAGGSGVGGAGGSGVGGAGGSGVGGGRACCTLRTRNADHFLFVTGTMVFLHCLILLPITRA